MKRIVSLTLVLVTFLSCFGVCLNASAAQDIVIDAKAYDNYYKVWWNYDKGATKFYVYVDGKLDGYKDINTSKSYIFTTDPYTAGIKHTIQVKAEKNGKIFAESQKINRYLAPLVPKLTYKCVSGGYTIAASVDSGTVHGFSLYQYNEAKGKYIFYKNFLKNITIKAPEVFRDKYICKAFVKYAKVYFSQYCDPITCVPKLETVKFTGLKSENPGQLTLTWDAVKATNYTGYQIFYSSYDGFGVFRVAAAAKGTTGCVLKLIPGICYKVKVRTYLTTNTGKIYGTWSQIRTSYTQTTQPVTPNVKYLLNYKVKVSAKPGATGCEKLNNVLDKILKKIGCGPTSTFYTYDKVRFAYRYIATEQFKTDGDFGVKGNGNYAEYCEGAVLRMIENKGATGSCYEYNYLFHFLCRRMGLYNTYMVDGMVDASGGGRTNHWWMMMKIAGQNYYYDPRMSKYINPKGLDFFCLPLNGQNKYSDYFRFYDAKAELK